MAIGNREVNLVIKATDATGQAAKTAAASYDLITKSATDAADNVNALGNQLTQLERQSGRLDNVGRQVSQGLEKERAKFAETAQAIEQKRARLAELTAAQERLNQATGKAEGAKATLSGDDLKKAKAELTQINREVATLNRELNGTKRTGGLDQQLTAQLEVIRQLRESQMGIRDQQSNVLRAIDATTAKLVEQSNTQARLAAEARARDEADARQRMQTAAQTFYNAKAAPGLSAPQQTGISRQRTERGYSGLFAPALDKAEAADEIAALKAAADAHKAFEDRVKQGVIEMQAEQAQLERNASAMARMQAAAQTFYNAKAAPGLSAPAQSGMQRQQTERDYSRLFTPLVDKKELEEAAAAHAAFEARVKQGVAAMEAEAKAAEKLQAAADLRNAAAAHAAFEARVKQGVAAMEAEAKAAEMDAAAIARIKAALDPVAAIRAKYNQQVQETEALHKRGKLTADELAAATKHLADEERREVENLTRGRANAPKVSLFGLAPWETQNLMYQINDVVSGLASGQRASQVLAQQGGQIYQIFQNRVGPAIGGALSSPVIRAGIVLFGTLAAALVKVAEEAGRTRDIMQSLSLNVDAKAYDPAKLSAAADALHRYGIAADDAAESFKKFAAAGFGQNAIPGLTVAAKGLAQALGTDLKDGVQTIIEGFSGGSQAVLDLDKKLNFLTADQRAHVVELQNQGHSLEAVNYAFGILQQKTTEANNNIKATTSLTNALSAAWNSFIGYLAHNEVFKAVTRDLTDLATGITSVLNRLSGLRSIQDIANDLEKITRAREGLANNITMLGDPLGIKQSQIATYDRQIAALKAELEKAKSAPPAGQTSGAAGSGGQAGGTGTGRDPANNRETKDANLLNDAQKRLRVEELQRLRTREQIVGTEERSLRLALAQIDAAERYKSLQISDKDRNDLIGKAVDAERAKIAKEDRDAVKANQSKREQELSKFQSRVIGAEGGAGDNPFSSASGFGQFTRGTWLEQFAKVFGDTGRSDEQILALRKNETVAKAIIYNYARENAKFLESFGAEVTAGNLYLAHFLGAGDAKKVLQAAPNTPVDQLGFSNAVLSGNKKYMYTDNGKGRARTAGELQKFIAGRVGDDVGSAQSAGEAALQNLETRQKELNREIDAENAKRQTSADVMKIEGDLTGKKLLDAQKARAVEEAVAAEREKYAKLAADGAKIDEAAMNERLKKTREVAAAEFDAAHQKQYRQAEVDSVGNTLGIDQKVSQRDQIQRQLEIAQKVGDVSGVQSLENSLRGVNNELRQMIDNALTALGALSGPEADAARAKLEGLKKSSVEVNNQFLMTGRQINETLANGIAGAVDKFAQSVAEGKNVFKSLRDAFLQFASDFLRQIAQMILKQLLFNALGGGSAGGEGGIGGTIATAITSLFHTGGIAGAGAQTRTSSPAWFAGAVKYHTGGVVGLAPDEVPSILRKGEEVLTQNDSRHRANGGMGGGSTPAIKIVNAVDGADALTQALNTKAGEKVILNYVKNNAAALKAAMG
ncbi:MAG: phage tail length tape measure family protein [Pseudomonadota bacterium]